MSMTDPIADLLTRVRNAYMRSHKSVDCLGSKMGQSILDVLKNEGFIGNFRVEEVSKGVNKFVVDLRYFEGKPAMKRVARVSKPGRRVYAPIQELKKVCNGLGVAVLSTSKGVLSDTDARRLNVGGEVLFEVY